MSANLVVDLFNTVDSRASLVGASGTDLTIGQIVDFQNAHVNTQVWCAPAGPGSGVIELRIQTSDSTASGTFTDPTSGIPTSVFTNQQVQSGGRLFLNSGLFVSGNSLRTAVVNNAPLFCSGGIDGSWFQRPHRYARLILNSGVYPAAVNAGFLCTKHQTSSGGGFSLQPSSGVVNV